ncbi:hypothetical protein HBB16_08540 [Pseudonocardia sp. MCCB 268]|nr:hypothetical protein [Pseudonocardia cytotoxica]
MRFSTGCSHCSRTYRASGGVHPGARRHRRRSDSVRIGSPARSLSGITDWFDLRVTITVEEPGPVRHRVRRAGRR